jgi:hypothetical protein
MEFRSQFIRVLILAAVMGSGCKPRLVGPFRVSSSGEFLFCGAKRGDSDVRYVIVPLKGSSHKPYVLSFPGTDKSLGVAWRPGTHPEELVFLTAIDSHDIKRFRVSAGGVEEVSSYALDPNILLVQPFYNPSGTVLAFRVSHWDPNGLPDPRVGLSKDNGRTISISECPWANHLLWADDTTFYVARVIDAYEKTKSAGNADGKTETIYRMAILKGELNLDSMKVVTRKISEGNDIYLAMGHLRGSLLYWEGESIFCDGKLLSTMPEKTGHVLADGDYIAVVSEDGMTLFALDSTGKVISRTRTREKSTCIGISAANKAVYLTAPWGEVCARVYAYDLFGKGVEVVFEAGSAFEK